MELGKQINRRWAVRMKRAVAWLVPAVIVTALLVTLGTFKRMEDVTKDEAKKISQYTNTLQ